MPPPTTPFPILDKIKVKVLAQDQFGYPVEGAVVLVEGKKIKKWLIFTAKTDKNGIVTFELELRKYKSIVEERGQIKIQLEKKKYDNQHCIQFLKPPFEKNITVEFKNKNALLKPYKVEFKITNQEVLFDFWLGPLAQSGTKRYYQNKINHGFLFYTPFTIKDFYPYSNYIEIEIFFKVNATFDWIEGEDYKETFNIDPTKKGIKIWFKVEYHEGSTSFFYIVPEKISYT